MILESMEKVVGLKEKRAFKKKKIEVETNTELDRTRRQKLTKTEGNNQFNGSSSKQSTNQVS